MNSNDPFTRMRTTHLDVINSMSVHDYKPIKSFDLISGIASIESARWEDEIFNSDYRTYKFKKQCKYSYHIARQDRMDFDLVLRACQTDKFNFQVIESTRFFHIRINIDNNREQGKPDLEYANSLASQFLQISPAKIQFKMVVGDKYPVFSSNVPRTFETMRNWDERIDGLLLNNSIVLIIYKVHFELQKETDLKEWLNETN